MRISDWSSDVCSSDLLMLSTPPTSASRRLVPLIMPAASIAPIMLVEHAIPVDSAVIVAGAPASISTSRAMQIGRASCRERVCKSVYISVVAVSLKKKSTHDITTEYYHDVEL